MHLVLKLLQQVFQLWPEADQGGQQLIYILQVQVRVQQL